jgi:hypothetical protein
MSGYEDGQTEGVKVPLKFPLNLGCTVPYLLCLPGLAASSELAGPAMSHLKNLTAGQRASRSRLEVRLDF